MTATHIRLFGGTGAAVKNITTRAYGRNARMRHTPVVFLPRFGQQQVRGRERCECAGVPGRALGTALLGTQPSIAGDLGARVEWYTPHNPGHLSRLAPPIMPCRRWAAG